MSDRSALSDRLQSLRAERDVSQAEVSDAVGISRSYLGGIERGHSVPGRESLVALANYYGVSLDWLASGEGDPKDRRSPNEAELIAAFRRLSNHEQEIVLLLCDALRRRQSAATEQPPPREPAPRRLKGGHG